MNRSERRKSPDQWWQVVASASPEHEVKVEGGPPVYVRGNVEKLTLVQLPDEVSHMSPSEIGLYLNGVKDALRAVGLEDVLIMPRGVEFVCLRPVSPEQGLTLSLRKQVRKPDATETH